MSNISRTILCVGMFCVLCCTAASVSAQKNPQKLALRKAKQHLEYEEYQAAIPHIQELLQTEPKSAYYNFWMGKCLYVTYRKNQALPYFDVVNEVNPDIYPDFHYYYGLTLHYNLSFDKAIGEYRKDLERYAPASAEYREVNNRISQCQYAKNNQPTKESKQVKISNMGASVNTEFSEHSPVITADNTVLAFTARRPESKGAEPEAGFYDEDVYISRKLGGQWSKSENIGLPVNSKGHDATISLSAKGKTMYIYRHMKDGGLYISNFDETLKGWTEPRSVGKPLNSRSYEASICQSADSSMLFFTSDRPGGIGGLDIYRVRKVGNEWGPPENLGPDINTPFNEDAPYFHPDGRTLYYSSNGPNSLGGYDIFVTEWDSTNDAWLLPINMGAPVNSPDDEIYFVLSEDGRYGYYASGMEGGFGEKDIYEVQFPYLHFPKRHFTVEVAGIVQDKYTQDTLMAWVRLRDKSSGVLVDSIRTGPQTGRYTFKLEPERAYSLEVSTKGYDTFSEPFDTPPLTDADTVLERNFYVGRLAPPPVVVEEAKPDFQHIYFDFDKYGLREASMSELDRIVAYLKKNPKLSIQVLGHTDWYGTHTYNVQLSNNRVQAAVEYLNSRGIDLQRIKTAWFSENMPLDPNDNDAGRQYNRRCEFQLIGSDGNPQLTSMRIRTGGEAPEVDHTRPRGQAGFDAPGDPVSASASDAATNPEPVMVEGNAPATGFVAAEAPAYMQGVKIKNVYFDYDKSELRPESRQELEALLSLLRRDPALEIVIKGHTDGKGNPTYNEALSQRRCKTVADFLQMSDIAPSRITLNGLSESSPVSSNDTEEGRQLNRRVELELRKQGKVLLTSGI